MPKHSMPAYFAKPVRCAKRIEDVELELILTRIKNLLDAHETLVLSIEDFIHDSLAEGPRKRLAEAIANSKRLIQDDD